MSRREQNKRGEEEGAVVALKDITEKELRQRGIAGSGAMEIVMARRNIKRRFRRNLIEEKFIPKYE